MPILIGLFRTEADRIPVLDFLDSLSPRERAAVLDLIRRLEQQGRDLGAPHVAPLAGTDGLFELRTRDGNVRLRVFCCWMPGGAVGLLEGVRKTDPGSQKRAIQRAVRHQKVLLAEPQSRLQYMVPPKEEQA